MDAGKGETWTVEDESRNARKSIKDGDCFHMLAVYSVRLRGSALHTCQQRLTVPTGKGWVVDSCNSIHSALGTSGTECGEDDSVSTGLVMLDSCGSEDVSKRASAPRGPISGSMMQLMMSPLYSTARGINHVWHLNKGSRALCSNSLPSPIASLASIHPRDSMKFALAMSLCLNLAKPGTRNESIRLLASTDRVYFRSRYYQELLR